MIHTRKNKGVCSRSTTVTIEDGIIQNVQVEDGCDGNLKAVCALLQGMSAEQAIHRMQNLVCGNKQTSCPAQIAICIQEALQEQ
jgi:uncharacterized protein (TIGR03905 family)